MQMKRVLSILILMLLMTTMLFAIESEDLQYIVKLYANGEYRIARLEIDKFLKNYPDSRFIPDVTYLKADILLRNEEYAAAQQLFQTLYEANSKPAFRAEVILGLAQSCFFQKEYKTAKDLFQRFNSQFPNHELNWRAYYFQGRIAYIQDAYRDSSELFENALRYKDDAQIYPALIRSLLKTGKVKEAEEKLMIIHNMRGADSWWEQSAVFYMQYLVDAGNYSRAIEYGNNLIAPQSQYYADYAQLMATACFETGDYARALEYLQSIKDPDETAQYYLAMAMFNLGNIADAKPVFVWLSTDAKQKDIRANSLFYLAKIEGETSLVASIRMLESFINDYPDNRFISAARYQLGLNYFKRDEYEQANRFLKQSVTNELDKLSREKARFMVAETDFLLNRADDALTGFSDYLKSYPQGKFRDEALFKSGLIRFQKREFRTAKADFERLLADYPESGKAGMANFYLGEIALNLAQGDQALSYYNAASQSDADQALVYERIARIYFKDKRYDEALASLNKMPDEAGFAFSKSLLAGDIHFAKKSYTNALEQYKIANQVAEGEAEKEQARSRMAWTYYQLRDYDNATSLYNDLSASSADRSKFLLLAAKAAFSADDFLSAADYYKQYLQGGATGDEKFKATLGIADSYYNLGDYKQAIQYYKQLIYANVPQAWFKSALDGLKWCARQSDEIDFVREIDSMLQREGGDSFKGKLLEAKANALTEEGRYAEAIQTCETIINQYFGYIGIPDVRLLLARCYSETGRYADAEKVFSTISSSGGKSEKLLYDWAQLKEKQNDNIAAIIKLTEASQISHDPKIWLDLLRLQKTENHPAFIRSYDEFMGFSKGLNREKAELIWVQYQIGNESTGMIEPVIENLIKSEHKEIRAAAQYWKGYVLYNKGQYEEAISELLRVRFLYPEIEDVKIEAEYLACFAYIELREENKAKERYEMIKEYLTPAQRAKLAQKLGVAE